MTLSLAATITHHLEDLQRHLERLAIATPDTDTARVITRLAARVNDLANAYSVVALTSLLEQRHCALN